MNLRPRVPDDATEITVEFKIEKVENGFLASVSSRALPQGLIGPRFVGTSLNEVKRCVSEYLSEHIDDHLVQQVAF